MNNDTTRIKERLLSLPQELFVAREQQYKAFCAHREAEQKLDYETALFLGRCPPEGKYAEQRRHAATIALARDGNIIHYSLAVDKAAALLAECKRATRLLEDEASALRNLTRLLTGENIRDAAGSLQPVDAALDIALDRASGIPF